MPAYILAPAAIIALTLFVAFRIDRAEQLTDDFTDCDSRTASLANLINGGGREAAAENRAGGGRDSSRLAVGYDIAHRETGPSA